MGRSKTGVPQTLDQERIGPAGEQAHSTADDRAEEYNRQAEALAAPGVTVAGGPQMFNELRKKLARGESLSQSAGSLAEALRFSGRITITFHQGKVTKTVLEECYFRGREAV